MATDELMPHAIAAQLGFLPVKKGPVRFAIGPPSGVTSNAWRVWTAPAGDVYIACRDNFKEAKVSLHVSGRWRMGFTTEAVEKTPSLIGDVQNRAWDVWDEPPPQLPGTVIAFKLVFPTTELSVQPEQRKPKEWKDVLFIEAAPPGRVTVVTLFITMGDVPLRHGSEPSFRLASLEVTNGRFAQLVAHTDVEGNLPEIISQHVKAAYDKAAASGIAVPPGAYAYMLGCNPDNVRYLVGGRMRCA